MFNIQQKTSCASVTESESADTDQLCSGSGRRYNDISWPVSSFKCYNTGCFYLDVEGQYLLFFFCIVYSSYHAFHRVVVFASIYVLAAGFLSLRPSMKLKLVVFFSNYIKKFQL